MTHQAPPPPLPGADPGRQYAQLREVLLHVRRIAGAAERADRLLDAAARVSGAYEAALPVARRRFDALAAESATWAAAGVEALLRAGEQGDPRPAAARLAAELERTLDELERLLG